MCLCFPWKMHQLQLHRKLLRELFLPPGYDYNYMNSFPTNYLRNNFVDHGTPSSVSPNQMTCSLPRENTAAKAASTASSSFPAIFCCNPTYILSRQTSRLGVVSPPALLSINSFRFATKSGESGEIPMKIDLKCLRKESPSTISMMNSTSRSHFKLPMGGYLSEMQRCAETISEEDSRSFLEDKDPDLCQCGFETIHCRADNKHAFLYIFATAPLPVAVCVLSSCYFEHLPLDLPPLSCSVKDLQSKCCGYVTFRREENRIFKTH